MLIFCILFLAFLFHPATATIEPIFTMHSNKWDGNKSNLTLAIIGMRGLIVCPPICLYHFLVHFVFFFIKESRPFPIGEILEVSLQIALEQLKSKEVLNDYNLILEVYDTQVSSNRSNLPPSENKAQGG